jgi:hypothetical protein
MSTVIPPYPSEFRLQMVKLVRAGRTPAEPAREFNLTAQPSPTGSATPPSTLASRCPTRKA